ncbi:MAG: glycosyltransferase [Bacillota bacterium]
MTTISACLIARDEEKNLPRCLASLAGAVDEIVLVDTGSTDRTCEIALDYGARVYHRCWEGDFSAARNYGLDQASGDWLLVIDADEELTPESAPRLRSLAQRREIEGYLVHVQDYLGDNPGGDYSTSLSFRFFRNRPEYRYTRRVHEQIECQVLAANPHAVTDLAPVTIRHYGYLTSARREKAKTDRNLALLQQELADNPDPFTHFNLGTEYMRREEYRQALDHLEQAWNAVDPRLAFAAELMIRIVLCLNSLGQQEQALERLDQAVGLYPAFSDLHYLRGEILGSCQRYSEAMAAYQRCIAQGPTPPCFSSLNGCHTFRSWLALGRLHEELGDDLAAADHFRKATLNGGGFAAYSAFVRVSSRFLRDPHLMAEGYLLLGGRTDENRRVLAKALLEADRFQAAELVLDSLDDADSSFLRGQCCFFRGDLAGAREQLELGYSRERLGIGELRWLIYCNALEGNQSKAEVLLSEMEDTRFTRALRALVGALSGLPSTAPPPPETYRELLRLLEEIIRAHNRAWLEKALSLLHGIELVAFWNELGKIYYRRRWWSMALAELEDCCRSGAVDPAALTILGELHEGFGEMNLAIDRYQRALALNQLQERARRGLKRLRYNQARVALLEGLQRYPCSTQLLQEIKENPRCLRGSSIPGQRQEQ